MALIDDIYQQFKNYFGESRVDMQIYSTEGSFICDRYTSIDPGDYVIFVHWPEVTVTNEHDESINIWGLYCATIIKPEGVLTGAPQFIRSIYDKVQWDSNYLHSHVSSIGKSQLSRFHTSCLGSGPINNTIHALSHSRFDDLNVWYLYCWELDKYVSVESLNGGPYHRMAEVGRYDRNGNGDYTRPFLMPKLPSTLTNYKTLIDALVHYIIDNKLLPFSYYDGLYHIALNYIDTVMSISNAFIQLYNTSSNLRESYPKESLYYYGILKKAVYINGNLYTCNTEDTPLEASVDTPLFTFKGNTVKLEIKDFKQKYETCNVTVLSPFIICYIMYLFLKYINVNYGRKESSTFFGQKFKIL